MLKSNMTFEAFLGLPEHEPPLEWLHGQVMQKWGSEEEMPSELHGALQGACYYVLRQWARPQATGRVTTETRSTTLAGTLKGSLVPDVSFVSATRLGGMPRHKPVTGAPDLAVEILSPGQSYGQLQERVEWFLANGSQLVWIIDGVDRSVTVHHPDGPPRVLRRDQDLANQALPGFHCSVSQLFAEAEIPEPPVEQP